MLSRRPFAAVVTTSALLVAGLAGCSSGKKVDSSASQCKNVTKPKATSTALPASAKSKGLTMATDPSYAPIEFTKSGGGFQGLDIDIANAIGQKLGVKINVVKAQFDGILAGLGSGRYDFSMSAFTDNCSREVGNDFVTYYKAGTSIGVKKGNPKKINGMGDLCGLRVAAEKGTTQATALTATKAGGATTLKGTCLNDNKKAPIPVLLPDQAGVNSAVVSGRADAFTGDSPIVAYQGKLVGGQIEVAGKTQDEAPYGIAFPKGSALVGPFRAAVQSLMDDGTYTKLVNKWGLADGAISKAVVDGAVG